MLIKPLGCQAFKQTNWSHIDIKNIGSKTSQALIFFHIITPEVDALKDKPWTFDDIWLISRPEEKAFPVKKAP